MAYLESTGALRVLVGGQRTGRCSSNERPIEWNQEGPAGPVGPAGPAGATLQDLPDPPDRRD
jgi:hypothetical protein